MASALPLDRQAEVARLPYVARSDHKLGKCSYVGPQSTGECGNGGYWIHITPNGEAELLCWSHTVHRVKRDRERAQAQGMQF